MGGRKGCSLKEVVGDIKKIRTMKKELLQGVKDNDPNKVVSASSRILAKSDTALESLAHGFLFVSGLKKSDYKRLSKKSVKERRKELAKKWALYRKDKGKKFDAAINRDIVDSATRILGSEK